MGIGLPYLAGIAIGLTDYDKNIDPLIKVGIVALPPALVSKVPMGGTIRAVAAGMLIGDIIQSKNWLNLGSANGGGFRGV